MGEMTIAPFTIPAGDPFDTTFCVSIPVQNKLNQRVLVRRNLNTVIIEFIIFFDFYFQIIPILLFQGEPFFYRIGLPGTKSERKEIKIEYEQLYRCPIRFKVNIDDDQPLLTTL